MRRRSRRSPITDALVLLGNTVGSGANRPGVNAAFNAQSAFFQAGGQGNFELLQIPTHPDSASLPVFKIAVNAGNLRLQQLQQDQVQLFLPFPFPGNPFSQPVNPIGIPTTIGGPTTFGTSPVASFNAFPQFGGFGRISPLGGLGLGLPQPVLAGMNNYLQPTPSIKPFGRQTSSLAPLLTASIWKGDVDVFRFELTKPGAADAFR